ncbi:hypothetical protein K439DRAFT_1614963 [Ramaria rubella]|nr:hypothetical protein K439DRAFT_1614963 [Ramaria rubella]
MAESQRLSTCGHFSRRTTSSRKLFAPCAGIAALPLLPGCPPKYMYAKKTGNTNLHVHLQTNHRQAYLTCVEEMGWVNMLLDMCHIVGQTTLDKHVVEGATSCPCFSQSAFANVLVKFIVADDQSINVIECPEFRTLLLLLREELKDKDIPHCTNIRKQILKTWEIHFQQLKKKLVAALGKISHTADICITNKDLLTAPMDSDSGSANPVAGNSAPTFPRPFSTCPSTQTYAKAHARDPIALGRHIVTGVRASSQQRNDFAAVIAHGNNHGEWEEQIQLTRVDGKVQVLKLQLLRDVDTRWDLVYGMAQCLRILQQPIDTYLHHPHRVEMVGCYRMMTMEWNILKDFKFVLEQLHAVQQVMSKQAMPLLSGALPALVIFMSRWENMRDNKTHLAPFIQPGLNKAYKYYNCMDDLSAYIITMVLNPAVKLSWFRKHWDAAWVKRAEGIVMDKLTSYCQLVATQKTPAGAPSTAPLESWESLVTAYEFDFDDDSIAQPTTSRTIEDEYRAYVEAPLSPKGTDLIKYWDAHASLYETFYVVVLDYLPIQAMPVPSKRPFFVKL